MTETLAKKLLVWLESQSPGLITPEQVAEAIGGKASTSNTNMCALARQSDSALHYVRKNLFDWQPAVPLEVDALQEKIRALNDQLDVVHDELRRKRDWGAIEREKRQDAEQIVAMQRQEIEHERLKHQEELETERNLRHLAETGHRFWSEIAICLAYKNLGASSVLVDATVRALVRQGVLWVDAEDTNGNVSLTLHWPEPKNESRPKRTFEDLARTGKPREDELCQTTVLAPRICPSKN